MFLKSRKALHAHSYFTSNPQIRCCQRASFQFKGLIPYLRILEIIIIIQDLFFFSWKGKFPQDNNFRDHKEFRTVHTLIIPSFDVQVSSAHPWFKHSYTSEIYIYQTSLLVVVVVFFFLYFTDDVSFANW